MSTLLPVRSTAFLHLAIFQHRASHGWITSGACHARRNRFRIDCQCSIGKLKLIPFSRSTEKHAHFLVLHDHGVREK